MGLEMFFTYLNNLPTSKSMVECSFREQFEVDLKSTGALF